MDSARTNGLTESIMSSKVDIPPSCEETIQLTKMEIVDPQLDVNLQNDNSQNIVEYINIHRVSDLAKNLIGDTIPPELLSHSVVDFASNSDYSQHLVTNAQFYENAEFLSQSFSDDDRRPNIVAVGVQLIPSDRTDRESDDTVLSSDIMNGKTPLPSVSTIGSEKIMSSIVPTYVQAVNSTIQHNSGSLGMRISAHHTRISEQSLVKNSVEEQDEQIIKLYQPLLQDKLPVLPPLKKIIPAQTPLQAHSTKYLTQEESNCNLRTIIISSSLNSLHEIQHQISEPLEEIKTESVSVDLTSDLGESPPTEEYESDCDNVASSSQKSLPHKKRIPSKLKRASSATPMRNLHTKCYKCTMCGEQFSTQATFNIHKQEQHPSNKMNFACELCHKTCPNQLKFFEHLKSHYEPGVSIEHLKNELISSVEQEYVQNTEIESSDRNENESQNIENEQPMYSSELSKMLTCVKCKLIFRKQTAFDCHMSSAHPNQEDIEEFSEPEDMMEGIRHVVNMVPGGDDEDKTSEAWESSSSIENVALPQPPVLHKETLSNISTNTTAVAPKNTSSPRSTKVALKKEDSESTDDEIPPQKSRKELACPHCERVFVHRNSLLYHIRSHTGHRPHQCEQCGKSFFAAGALKIHLRLHSGDKPYKCEYCGRFFRQWGDLKYHITSLHSNTKMFQCEFCGKDFARKYSLVVHRRIHTGEKNYICEYCTKTFRAASYLQNHRRIHTGEKPHACQVCGKLFRVRSDMKRHMKTHPDVNLANVLSERPNNRPENNGSTRLVINVNSNLHKQEDITSVSISDPESENNIKPVLHETMTALDMNTSETVQTELFDYQRAGIEDDRENTNGGTLYVWIQTGSDSILPDT